MKISEYAIKNYQFTLIMVLMVIALGVSTILSMPRSEDPALESPGFPVVVVYPGTSPKDMEELVVKPLEQKLYGLDNIKRIKTRRRDVDRHAHLPVTCGVGYRNEMQPVRWRRGMHRL